MADYDWVTGQYGFTDDPGPPLPDVTPGLNWLADNVPTDWLSDLKPSRRWEAANRAKRDKYNQRKANNGGIPSRSAQPGTSTGNARATTSASNGAQRNVQNSRYLDVQSQASGGSEGPAAAQRVQLEERAIRAGLEKDALGQAHILGLAAQAPTVLVAPRSTDKPPAPALDGHAWSQVADHPDGLFALNTAATSNFSQDANNEAMSGGLFGERSKRLDGAQQESQAHRDALTSLAANIKALIYSTSLPRQMGSVSEAQEAPTRMPTGNLLTGEWTTPQLAGIGVGTLLLGGLAQRVF